VAAAAASPLISPAELAELLDGRGATVLDVRWSLATGSDRDSYLAGHVPTAQFVDLDQDLADVPGSGGRHPLPPRDGFVAAMQRCGVHDCDPVVAYDAHSGLSAARAWWLLRYFGHDDVRVLDGGYPAWLAAGGKSETEIQAPRAGAFCAEPGGMPVLSADDAAALAGSGVLLDVRAPERFRGDQEPIDPVAGHIPGAVNLPATDYVAADGRLLPAQRLRERFGDLANRPTGAYCGSGVTAAHTVLALEAAGIAAALYPGSWSGWITDPTRPVATGPASR